jgi:hypothetical protein
MVAAAALGKMNYYDEGKYYPSLLKIAAQTENHMLG